MFSTTPLRKTYDAVIVGARVAGAATALLLARRGLSVLVLERSRYASDALSTHALMRPGVLQLARLGVLDAVRATGASPVRAASFHYGTESRRVAIEPRDGVDALYAPRRHVLDRVLVDAACAAGATVVHGVRVDGLFHASDGRVRGVIAQDALGEASAIEAGIVIGADGYKSTVARLAAARRLRVGKHAAACVFGYYQGFSAEGYEWWFGAGVSASVIPTDGGLACVAVGLPRERFVRERAGGVASCFGRVLREVAPELSERVRAAQRVGGLRSFEGAAGHLRVPHGPGWALVGDAGYFKDPATAHGMSDALRDAELLARAVDADTAEAYARYRRTRDALSLPFFEATERIASFEWDFAELRRLHKTTSEAMAHEQAALLALPALDSTGSRAA